MLEMKGVSGSPPVPITCETAPKSGLLSRSQGGEGQESHAETASQCDRSGRAHRERPPPASAIQRS